MNPSKLPIVAVAFLALGLLLASMAITIYVHSKRVQPTSPSGALASSSAPSSVKPKAQAVATYTVPADNPKYISIPAINTGTVRVLKLGLLSNGSMSVPGNIYDAGWYDASTKPGQEGVMFIYGHVSSWTAEGVFYELKKLKPGDKIIITTGNDTVYTYQVDKLEVYPYDTVPMNTVLTPTKSAKPGLNVMTCTGSIIKGTSEFSERLVVFASLIKS
jgi:sortase A